MFAQIYICPTHGETWHVENAEIIDTVNDEVYPIVLCGKCHTEVRPLVHDSRPVYHALSHEDMFWEMYSDEENDGNDD